MKAVELPAGIVTLMFTDIAASTRLLQRLGDDRFDEVLAIHNDLLRTTFAAQQGHEVYNYDDGFIFAFADAVRAVAGAVDAQRQLAACHWPPAEGLVADDAGQPSPREVGVQVRMGLHTGTPRLTAGGYGGMDVYRSRSICAAAHGGQILLSRPTAESVGGALPAGVTLRDLGEHRLMGTGETAHLFQAVAPGLRCDFPPVRALAAAAGPDRAPPLMPPGRPGSRIPARAGLTPREVEIVRLIAAGRSNSEIAHELVLSVRTVERHIENVYAKLGVHGQAARAAVAAYAARHGLLADR